LIPGFIPPAGSGRFLGIVDLPPRRLNAAHWRDRPVNELARAAVGAAHVLLLERGYKVTTERKGKWHALSRILADTDKDLRHHLIASLIRAG